MKKMMLMLGMVAGCALTYMMMNKNMRDMAQNKINCMFDEADKMLGE